MSLRPADGTLSGPIVPMQFTLIDRVLVVTCTWFSVMYGILLLHILIYISIQSTGILLSKIYKLLLILRE